MSNIDLLKNIWKSVYDPHVDVTETIEKYFHPNYQQCINGVRMNRAEYIDHVAEQKKNIKVDTIDYKHILEKGNELFALYYPKGRNIKNDLIEAEVIAYFCFEQQQLYRIHGQVRMIQGNYDDVDMNKI